MRKIPILVKREFISYFFSPTAYIILTVFLAISGFFFSNILVLSQEATMRYLLSNIAVILLFISPIITMRLLSEEKKSGTIESLMTDPVTDTDVVLGKFLGAVGFYIILLIPTLAYVIVLKIVGKPDFGPIITGYLGLILLGSVFLSIGIFASSLCKNQIIAAVVSFVVLLFMWIIGFASETSNTAVAKITSYISIFEHFDTFRRGIIDTRDLIYYISTCSLFLFLTVKAVESRKWK